MAKLKTGRHTSALKAHRQSVKHRWANAAAKERARSVAKELLAAIAKKDAPKAKEILPKAVSVWTRLGNKNIVHRSTASRKIARLSRAIQKIA